ncbi:hypothetical protein CGCF415_v006818 [Colletotrichum fructicola]|uniref:Uncharacterized protein n=1 Tax=Colletotrichum fructicola (strain Nara gc5) TaxID=1213859 RepID=L2G3R9_COLFN|nr:uncharacterized protein CGMCC3_g1690 [Colletotrichum fructicola]KAF4485227.1 hypothetical protein CGGC5_v008413 [Colletotrichum fructicola Nara gc5]KAF4809893.1 hypothetical protein CGCSCA5_v010987 [Colletotrichum siamense]KAI8267643.1 hypothetical protein K4K58_007537 [Colletotrichum sp. SAR11_239]KAE9582357.1 hypothetical protein CGMCC3_g1690 [Colletotrichum fructicola]KAF4431277.1 hypothetical protein CFRS1_v008844 [Colletotrichum fructicola]
MQFSSVLACLIMAPLALAVPADMPSQESSLALRAADNIEIPDNLPEDWKTALEAYFKDTELDVETRDLDKRSDVPFMHCGWRRFFSCLGSLTPGGVTCMWAIAARGLDVKEDSKCTAAVVASILSASNNCKLCVNGHL